MTESSTRRRFLESTGLAAGGAALGALPDPASRTEQAAGVAANEKLNVALIGCGGMGGYNLEDFMRAEEVVFTGLCDIDDGHLNSAAEKVEKKYGSRPKTTKDYR